MLLIRIGKTLKSLTLYIYIYIRTENIQNSVITEYSNAKTTIKLSLNVHDIYIYTIDTLLSRDWKLMITYVRTSTPLSTLYKGNVTINFITVVLMEYFLFSAKIWIENSNGAKLSTDSREENITMC